MKRLIKRIKDNEILHRMVDALVFCILISVIIAIIAVADSNPYSNAYNHQKVPFNTVDIPSIVKPNNPIQPPVVIDVPKCIDILCQGDNK